MDILHPEFLLFLRCAQTNNLRYMLIGGYAVNYYGYNRNTDDMDIWLAPTNENKKALPLIEEANKNGFGVIARMPLQFGLLTGKFTEDAIFADDDHRKFRLTKEIISKTNKILEEKVWTLCEKYNISKTSLALSFILTFDAVSTVIPGIRTAQHAVDNTTNMIRFDKNDVDLLKALYNSDWKEIVELMEKQG